MDVCSRCGQLVTVAGKRCPRCGSPVGMRTKRLPILIGIAGVLALLFVVAIMVVVIQNEDLDQGPPPADSKSAPAQ